MLAFSYKQLQDLPQEGRIVTNCSQLLTKSSTQFNFFQVIHDSYCCERDWNSLPSQPFSTERQNMTFVSGRSGGGWNALEKCPVKCRPLKHKNWEYC